MLMHRIPGKEQVIGNKRQAENDMRISVTEGRSNPVIRKKPRQKNVMREHAIKNKKGNSVFLGSLLTQHHECIAYTSP